MTRLTEIRHPGTFKSGYRALILVRRKKDGVSNPKQLSFASSNEMEWDALYESMCEMAKPGERIYSSVSERDPKKAMREFKRKQLDADYDEHPEDFYMKSNNHWISSLMAPSSTFRDTKLWLYDADNAVEIMIGENLPYVYSYDTKNGTHYLLKPTDLSELKPEIASKIDKNGMMLWAY